MNKQDLIKNSKRVVIKIGSALLIDSKTGKLQKNWLETLAFDIHNLINSGVEVNSIFRVNCVRKKTTLFKR